MTDAFKMLAELTRALRAGIRCADSPEGDCLPAFNVCHRTTIRRALERAEKFIAAENEKKSRAPS